MGVRGRRGHREIERGLRLREREGEREREREREPVGERAERLEAREKGESKTDHTQAKGPAVDPALLNLIQGLDQQRPVTRARHLSRPGGPGSIGAAPRCLCHGLSRRGWRHRDWAGLRGVGDIKDGISITCPRLVSRRRPPPAAPG